MIAMPVRSAMEVRRVRSFPVGMPEINCRKRFLRPCFSRVFSAAKSRSSTAIAVMPQVLAQFSRRVRAWRTWASRWPAVPVRSKWEAARIAGWVAVPVEAPGGEAVGVGVHADHTVREGGLERDGLRRRVVPGGGQVPAAPVRVVIDAVGDGPVRFHTVGPLGAPVRERDTGGEGVPAVPGVRQTCERGG